MTGDLRDLGGRMRRLVLAVLVGSAAFALTWRLASLLRLGNDDTGMRGWGLFWFGLTAGAGLFAITLAELNRRARGHWQMQRLPRARVRYARLRP